MTGAKSPLNQIFTSVAVLIIMVPLRNALRFLPQAVLSAITMSAVIDQQPPQKLFAGYFRLSFAESFVLFMAFNIVIIIREVGVEIGTAVGVGLLVLYAVKGHVFPTEGRLGP
jgi:MFS superfamily sulfate permease-like transporter